MEPQIESPLPVLDGWFERQPTIAPTASIAARRTARRLRLNGCVLQNFSGADASVPLWEVNLREHPMERGKKPLEFVVHLPRGKVSFFAPSDEVALQWQQASQKAGTRDINAYYEVGDVLGEGAFAQVYLARSISSGEEVAIKKIQKFDDDELETLMQEINILRSVDHPNIIRTYDIFDTPAHMHIVLEYIQGGELFDKIASAGRFSEKNASMIVRQMFAGLQYLHIHSIVHRDIKPENVLCANADWPLHIKLCDFGLAEVMAESKKDTSVGLVGTPGYVAPEVVRRQPIGPPVDMWACGVLLYIMLSGKMPFYGRDEIECLRRIARGMYEFPEREWRNISPIARSLVKGLLNVDQEKRLSASAALHHPFITSHDISDAPIENDLSGLSSSRRKLQKVVKAVMTVNQLKEALSGNSNSKSSKA
uniref:Protein kinase domain-containing protein n=1 Tax=Erythrolobus australicus TaxID=1077150 RepID=A0A7S1TNH6_9RHOD|mmetsp:Transcript_3558/g.9881  ORF Transcript_3558/g.9881 Transcript_3558/m.9881 type:complete len:423 (+) Transcript_3558:84-1352(+)